MLRDRYQQLLTAYVDGELSSRQRRLVARLLRRSAEARQLLEQMQADSRALRDLPQPHLPVDLTGSVLRSIHERQLTPGRSRLTRISQAPTWRAPLASLAAAAAVLILLGVATYLSFLASMSEPTTKQVAQPEPSAPAAEVKLERLGPSIASVADEPKQAEKVTTTPSAVQSTVRKGTEVVRRPEEKHNPDLASNATPSASREPPLTDRVERFPLERVPDLLPVILKLSDLEQKSGRKLFLDELQKDSNFRLELPCPHGTKAVEQVQAAARTLHMTLLIEKQAAERIKMKWRTSYAVYLDDVTPEELTNLLSQIGREDRKSKESQFDRFVLLRMTSQHRKELSTLLGVDPITTDPVPSGPLGTDVRKPLADQTADQVAATLAGKGRAVRTALVLAYNASPPSPGSEEIKRFLDNRKPLRPGALRILLLLRN